MNKSRRHYKFDITAKNHFIGDFSLSKSTKDLIFISSNEFKRKIEKFKEYKRNFGINGHRFPILTVEDVYKRQGNTWMFLDELEVFAERNEEAVSYPLVEVPPPDDSNNIAKGRPYKTTLPAEAAYPDEGKVSLTDGKKGRLNHLDPAWSG